MSENTRQFRWIVTIAGNLAALFRDRADVFVGGNQFWYPVQGDPKTVISPDIYVVFGRPKGDRPSYKQWEEGNIPLTVAFEILSPSTTATEMTGKLGFYQEYGVEEYYVFDPDANQIFGFLRKGELLALQRNMNGFASPRLGIVFDLNGPEMVIRRPGGEPFLTFEELDRARTEAEGRAVEATALANQLELRFAKLSELTRLLLAKQASPEQVEELQRLLRQT